MTPAALKALKESIAHWERLVKTRPANVTQDEPYAEHCALCKWFFVSPRRCKGCPVSEKTGQTHCIGTPYYEAERAWRWLAENPVEPSAAASCKEKLQLNRWRKAARAELRFLKSLLPKAEKV